MKNIIQLKKEIEKMKDDMKFIIEIAENGLENKEEDDRFEEIKSSLMGNIK